MLLDELVDRTRTAGVPVDVVVSGEPCPLPPGTDLCAYQILQESLTNALKQAGPARTRLEVGYGERALTLRVSDDSRPKALVPDVVPDRTASGHARTRRAVRGCAHREPAEDGGFHVVTRLPTTDRPRRSACSSPTIRP
ncbi:hypothetical protein AB0J40_08130 [Amycolatopsis sp. NPDC049691]|uniref:sensor histidine kinase n=1 Tax=Amycolatopsis sp. NPDC049691 TaxID=3155155 RepID=UPI00342198AF